MDIDHLVITATSVETGARAVEAALGVPTEAGGAHPHMGTRNRLLSLGPDTYLEVIAVDPGAPLPGHPRWFGLDAPPAAPRLSNWAARVTDMIRALGEAPMGMGERRTLSRGDLSWDMAIPQSGTWPFDGVVPALLSWTGAMPQDRLTDRGCRLQRLLLIHPRMGDLSTAWPRLLDTPRVTGQVGPQPAIVAEIATPTGLKILSGALAA